MDRKSLHQDGIVFLYNIGVVLSGMYLAAQVGIGNRVLLFLVATPVALGWTIYFRLAMYSRLRRTEPEAGSESESTPNG